MTLTPTQFTTLQDAQQLTNATMVESLASNDARQAAFANLAMDVARAVDSYLRRKKQAAASVGFNADSQVSSTPQYYGQNE